MRLLVCVWFYYLMLSFHCNALVFCHIGLDCVYDFDRQLHKIPLWNYILKWFFCCHFIRHVPLRPLTTHPILAHLRHLSTEIWPRWKKKSCLWQLVVIEEKEMTYWTDMRVKISAFENIFVSKRNGQGIAMNGYTRNGIREYALKTSGVQNARDEWTNKISCFCSEIRL